MLAFTVNSPVSPVEVLEGAPLVLDFSLTDPAVTFLSVTYDWGDGSPQTTLDNLANPTVGPVLSATDTHAYGPGDYTITITGVNFLQPVPESQTVTILVSVKKIPVYSIPRILFGPILPSDLGHPNSAEWDLDLGINTEVIRSSIKMLLLTARGDRVMEPNYGTNLKMIIFDPSTPDIDSFVSDEIRTGLQTWEPRGSLVSFAIERTDRSATFKGVFQDNISGNVFPIQVSF